jgi:hypothetical protein
LKSASAEGTTVTPPKVLLPVAPLMGRCAPVLMIEGAILEHEHEYVLDAHGIAARSAEQTNQ